jgi:hypothetical protein
MTVRSDNAVTVFNLHRQGAGPALLHLTRTIFRVLQELDILLHVMHIPGVDNSFTDALSRMDRAGDYLLRQDIFDHAVAMLQVTPSIDLFANSQNRKTYTFAALPGPLQTGAAALDAFSLPTWGFGIPYLFPPVGLLDRVILRVRQ